MVQLSILTGKTAGSFYSARRFPIRIGRAQSADLRLEEDGVWDKHAAVRLENKQRFVIEAEPNAILSINGEQCRSAQLRNGDLLEIGSVKARFWLAPAKQKRLAIREALFWTIVVAVSLGQVTLVYLMVR